MRIPDLTPLSNNDAEYERLVSAVSEHYKCEWDDAIHDSYGIYVKQVQENAHSVRIIRCKTEELAKEAEGLGIEKKKKKAMDLCKEAGKV